ncbi:MAG: polyribonucleotide nucleotidyltransferase [Patescibacteria group bacterium]
MAFKKKQFSIEVGGKTLTFEVSDLAGQANSAVLTRYGDTVVLTTVVMAKKDAPLDYLPLKVDYEERFYAAGKIIGSRFIRREGRPSDEAILAGRLIDRAMRPLFNDRFRREVQVVVTVLEIDDENEPEFAGFMGASLALGISDVPWGGPVAGVGIAEIDGKFVINPTNSEVRNKHTFDAFVAGVTDRINMIELAGDDASEKRIIEGFGMAQKEINRLVKFQQSVISEIGKSKAKVKLSEPDSTLVAAVSEFLSGKLESAVYHPIKLEHASRLGQLKDEMFDHLREKLEEFDGKAADFLFEDEINKLVHENILEKERRPDGRRLNELRELNGEVALFPRTHGSALFVRGNTQALGVTTLAPTSAEQLIETMETNEKRRFMLHYNFPHFSVGEVGSSRGPGRREIGHGNLARKAVEPLIPPKDQFPYTIRIVSEILSSNGSSSMATVCASVLSLMDAGVPIKKPAAGIAMGLMMGQGSRVKGQEEYKVLTDIQGPEDHHGDMDLKAAGTDDGVNALQMDVKVDGITLQMLEHALSQAKDARLEILKFMKTLLPSPRPKISSFAPKIRTLKINPEKIGALIGPGGKVINGLIAKYVLTSIDVEENGDVFIFGDKEETVEAAMAEILAITKEFKVGEIVEGTVVRILDFGAIVDLGGGKDGMVHVSELKEGFVKQVSEVLKEGDFVKAKIIRADADGRIGLSIKQLK